jgi:hypothetical protein
MICFLAVANGKDEGDSFQGEESHNCEGAIQEECERARHEDSQRGTF